MCCCAQFKCSVSWGLFSWVGAGVFQQERGGLSRCWGWAANAHCSTGKARQPSRPTRVAHSPLLGPPLLSSRSLQLDGGLFASTCSSLRLRCLFHLQISRRSSCWAHAVPHSLLRQLRCCCCMSAGMVVSAGTCIARTRLCGPHALGHSCRPPPLCVVQQAAGWAPPWLGWVLGGASGAAALLHTAP